MSFKDLGLAPEIMKAIDAVGYTEPTPIQAQAIPQVLAGRDVLGIAQTGTGKTASFTLPMIHRLMNGRAKARMPRTLILEPTRELAAQVAENFDLYGKNTKLTKALLIGGVSFKDQEIAITRGADVLIATPGRLLDHVERGGVLLRGVEVLVIDEADRMLDMGFIPDIERIVALVPFTRQTLFFSATMPPEITRLSEQFLSAPKRIEVTRPASTNENVSQRLIKVAPMRKRAALWSLFEAEDVTNGIIFCNRKRDIGDLLKSLHQHGYKAVSLHGDMDQHMRLRMLDQFKNGEATYLIASDVAARGLDIPAVSHIFNFDVPSHAEDYVHRIGRTGRAGRSGATFTLATPNDTKYVRAIETLIEQEIPLQHFKDSAIDEDEDESPPRHHSNRGNRGNHANRNKTDGDTINNTLETGERTTNKRADNKPAGSKRTGQRRGLLGRGNKSGNPEKSAAPKISPVEFSPTKTMAETSDAKKPATAKPSTKPKTKSAAKPRIKSETKFEKKAQPLATTKAAFKDPSGVSPETRDAFDGNMPAFLRQSPDDS